ncbi:hypothetical protein FA95DRAFT_1559438 [Auriscalpium vulgare]|uniref:Uncharacterized protein n=1 Tax=Auriscalpium vulgare TaxID=40419 RepID=A0ACB8RSD6_9AGAM|nr:hypothetical protein FA95DRAFT_1559438 [Auriscalpium vulgare]
MYLQNISELLAGYDEKALYYAARITLANLRLRALLPDSRPPYFTLFANETLTALRYLSSLKTAGHVPLTIVSARDALLEATASGAEGWNFNQFSVNLESEKYAKFEGSLEPDLWWEDTFDVASRRAKEVNVSLEDVRNAWGYQHWPTSPRDAPYQTIAPALLAPPPTLDRRIRKRDDDQDDDEDEYEDEDEHELASLDDTYSPRSAKRWGKRPRTSSLRPVSTAPRKLADSENEHELPADAIVVAIKKTGRAGRNRYLIGTTSSPRMAVQCDGCFAAGDFPCIAGTTDHCTLCSMRRQVCHPRQSSALTAPTSEHTPAAQVAEKTARRQTPVEHTELDRATWANLRKRFLSGEFDIRPKPARLPSESKVSRQGDTPTERTELAKKDSEVLPRFDPRPARRISESEASKCSDHVVIARMESTATPGVIDIYCVGHSILERQCRVACTTCSTAGLLCLVNEPSGRGCKLCVAMGVPCDPSADADAGASTDAGPSKPAAPVPSEPVARPVTIKHATQPVPSSNVIPRFVLDEETFPADRVVAELTMRGGMTRRYLLGTQASPRRTVECAMCRTAGVPCLVYLHGTRIPAKGCTLCSLRRTSCVPADTVEQPEQAAGTSLRSGQKAAAAVPDVEQDIRPRKLGDAEDEKKFGANVIVAHVKKPSPRVGYFRYVLGVYGAPINEVECETCHYAETQEGTRCPCLRGGKNNKGCVLCAVRTMPCIPYTPRAAQPPASMIEAQAFLPAVSHRRTDEDGSVIPESPIDVDDPDSRAGSPVLGLTGADDNAGPNDLGLPPEVADEPPRDIAQATVPAPVAVAPPEAPAEHDLDADGLSPAMVNLVKREARRALHDALLEAAATVVGMLFPDN